MSVEYTLDRESQFCPGNFCLLHASLLRVRPFVAASGIGAMHEVNKNYPDKIDFDGKAYNPWTF